MRIALSSRHVISLHSHRASIASGSEPVQCTKKGPRAALHSGQTWGAARLRAGLWLKPLAHGASRLYTFTAESIDNLHARVTSSSFVASCTFMLACVGISKEVKCRQIGVK